MTEIGKAKEITIFTDGACDPNPGPGGYGVVLIYGQVRKEVSGGFRHTTNNRMEIYAAISALEQLREPCHVTLYSDSQYVVKAMMDGWVSNWKKKNWWRSPKERARNVDLWEKLLGACEQHQVTFVWVKGHAGNADNERCDQLAMAALQGPGLSIDEGYENAPDEVESVQVIHDGEPCRKCATPVVKAVSRKLKSYLVCPGCQAIYELEQPPTAERLSLF